MHKIKASKGWYLMSKKNKRIKGPTDEKTIDHKKRQIIANQKWNAWYRKYHPQRVRR